MSYAAGGAAADVDGLRGTRHGHRARGRCQLQTSAASAASTQRFTRGLPPQRLGKTPGTQRSHFKRGLIDGRESRLNYASKLNVVKADHHQIRRHVYPVVFQGAHGADRRDVIRRKNRETGPPAGRVGGRKFGHLRVCDFERCESAWRPNADLRPKL
jgi:hypothetical protein